ncbi:MAG: hypothetical protein JXA21_20820 [Anaerolineae bacterium]|nr:hypothetical protein [Anaerolineae bacterium]
MHPRPVQWLFRQFEQVQAYQREQMHLQILVTEIGVGRAVARALGAAVPSLEAKKQGEERWEKPEWMRRFEEANTRS